MRSNKKKLSIILISLGLIGFISYQIFWMISLQNYPKEIRPALKKVSKAYYISKISGGYWENEMEFQAKVISTLPQELRIEFFRGVMIITCDLDTSRATSFVQLLGKDAEALRNNLINFQESNLFFDSPQKQQKVVSDWINELAIITAQQKYD